MNHNVPIFFACDENYVPYLDVAIISIIKNSSKNNNYEITILESNISKDSKKKILKHSKGNIKINFYDANKVIEPIKEKLPNVFYYGLAAYFRLFIETAFPQYDKIIYLDCDVVLLNDVAKLYEIELGDNLVAAAFEQNTNRDPMFTNYVKDIIGIPSDTYFNSGVMVMNLKEFRNYGVQNRFIDMLITYNFDSLAPDQEYLNVICHGKVKYLPTGWNKQSFPEAPEDDLNLCHFALANKPWHYKDTINGEYFWKYAKYSEFYDQILDEFNNFSEEDRRREYDGFLEIVNSIQRIYESENTFSKVWFKN